VRADVRIDAGGRPVLDVIDAIARPS
jgi:hypothetical protein